MAEVVAELVNLENKKDGLKRIVAGTLYITLYIIFGTLYKNYGRIS